MVCFYFYLISKYFSKIASNGVTANEHIWNAVKPFLTFKSFLHDEQIVINFDNRTITDDKESSTIFNEYYINIVKHTASTSGMN